MNRKLKISGLLLIGSFIASLVWSFCVFFMPVGNVDGKTIYRYELSVKLNESAGNAVKNLGKEAAFGRAMKELKISVTNAEVDREFNAMVEKYGGIYELEKIMLDMQGNADTLKRSIRTGMLKQKAIESFAVKVSPNEKGLRDYFDLHWNQYSDYDSERSQILTDYRMEKGAEEYETYLQEQESRISIKVY